MKNGKHEPSRETEARLRDLQKLVLALAEHIDFIENAVMLLYSSVIDLSDRSGSDKNAQNKKMLNAVLRLHRKSWRRKRKQLSRYL